MPPGSEAQGRPDDGRLEVEFEIDTNRRGQKWRVRVSDNGQRIFKGRPGDRRPQRVVSVELRTANRAGTDVIRARAKRGDTVCRGRLAY